jgi:hypothetical protein
MRRVADILHKQAVKEEPISPKLRNFIRAVVYSSQTNNNSYSINGDVGNSLKDGDMFLMIDVYRDRIIMQKREVDPIEFNLMNRTIKMHGLIFDAGNGELMGLTDNVDLEHPRVNFTVSERVISDIIKDINMIKAKIDIIIQMLTDIEVQIDTRHGQMVNLLGVIKNDIIQTVITETGALGVIVEQLNTDLSGSIEQLDTDLSAEIGALGDKMDDFDTSISGKIDDMNNDLTEKITNLGDYLKDAIDILTEDMEGRTDAIDDKCDGITETVNGLASTVASNYNALKSELDDIKALIEQL